MPDEPVPFVVVGDDHQPAQVQSQPAPHAAQFEPLDDSERDDVGPIVEHDEDIERAPVTMTSEEFWSQHKWSATSNPVRWQLYDQSHGTWREDAERASGLKIEGWI